MGTYKNNVYDSQWYAQTWYAMKITKTSEPYESRPQVVICPAIIEIKGGLVPREPNMA